MGVKEKGQNRKVPGRIIKNNVSGRNYVKDIRYRHTCILSGGFVCVCICILYSIHQSGELILQSLSLGDFS